MPISDEIIQRRLQRQQSPETGIANQVLQRKVQRNFEPTGVSTMLGYPVEKYVGKGGTGASYWTHLKQGFVDDPFTKVRIYAKDRFPELDEEDRIARYAIKDNEIIFKGDDDKWYSENPDLFSAKLKNFLGETTANLPAIALGTAGEIAGGPVGAGLGAAAGETIRKNIGTYAFGQEPSVPGLLTGAGAEAALGGVGSIPGRTAIRGLRKIGGAFGGKKGRLLVKATGAELPLINFKKAAKLQKQVKNDFGVDLWDAQTTESRRLLNKLNLYGDLPETSDIVQHAKRMQDDQAFKAADRYFDSLYDPDPEFISAAAVKMRDGKIIYDESNPFSPFDKVPRDEITNVLDDKIYVTNKGRTLTSRETADFIGEPTADPRKIVGRNIPGTESQYAGQAVSDAAQKSIDREIRSRVNRAKPFYDKAFAKKTEIDIQPHIDALNEMVLRTPETSPRRRKLQEFKRLLHRTVIDKNKKKKLVPESRIEYLDELKKSIDEFLEPKVGDKPISNRTKKDIRTIKNSILEDLDDANNDYKIARRIWADDSEAVKRLTHKTRLQGIASLEGDQVDNAARMLFTNLRNNPRIVRRARARIMREDPEAWRAAIRVHVEDLFYQTQQSAAGGAENTAKIFNSFYRRTIGTKKQRDILAAAMGGKDTVEFKTFENFADMLRRVALVVKKESATASRQEMLKEDLAGGGFVARQIAARFKPLVTHRRLAWEKMLELQTNRGRKLMAEAMTDPRASQHLLKIRKMNLSSEKAIRATSTFLSLVLGGEFKRHGTQLYRSYKSEEK